MVKTCCRSLEHSYQWHWGVDYREGTGSVIRAKTGDAGPPIQGFATSSTVHLDLDDVAQAATYSGYKRNHGTKFQGVVLPNGIIADLWGPVVGSRHEGCLMISSLDARPREVQVGNHVQYYAYGDTAYAVLSHVKHGFKTSAPGLSEAVENENMSV
ncbi:unnamed protein product [Discosporangium mesarthrocarpum]